MVLVSHKHKFIYIKTAKVAGSSVEAFFGQFCVGPKAKYNFKDRQDAIDSHWGIVGNRMGGITKSGITAHMTAKAIRRRIGVEKFGSYFKFCVVRNPWDVLVSRYLWRTKKTNSYSSFKNFVKGINGMKNWNIMSIDDKLVCDYYIRFENLEAGVCEVCEKLDIKDYDISKLPHHKSGIREDGDRDWRKFYDNETRALVEKLYKPYIEKFGYSFDD